jgi:hypothetical protein
MASDKARHASGKGRHQKSAPARPAPDPMVELDVDLDFDIDLPLADLMETAADREVVEELGRQAAATPASVRLAEVVAFVGKGLPSTPVGNLRPRDAMALAERLANGDRVSGEVRSLSDLPETAHAFRWAVLAELLTLRGARIVPGRVGLEMGSDPLATWFEIAMTLLDNGLLEGFRTESRKSYVALLDDSVTEILVGLGDVGGVLSLSTIEDGMWTTVARGYGFELDDDRERRQVDQLVGAMVTQLADLGAVTRRGGDVVLTGLGGALGSVLVMAVDDDMDDLDLDDFDPGVADVTGIDAGSLLLMCCDEPVPVLATAHLQAWCQARDDADAADELCQAMLEDDDRQVWHFGLQALTMVDSAVAEPAVQRLRLHTGLRPLATEWLRRHGKG